MLYQQQSIVRVYENRNAVWDPVQQKWVAETQPGGGSGGAVTIADGADVAQGSTGDAPWVAGSGTVISLLKKIASAGGGAVSIADGSDVAEGATTDAAVVTDTAGTVSGKLRGLVKWAFERMPASLGQKVMAASLPVVVASDQSAIAVTSTPIANSSFSFTFSGGADPTYAIPAGMVVLTAMWTTIPVGGSMFLQVSNDGGVTYQPISNVPFEFVLPFDASPDGMASSANSPFRWFVAGYDHIKLVASGLTTGTISLQFSAQYAPGRAVTATLVAGDNGGHPVNVNNSKNALFVDDVGPFAESSKNAVVALDTVFEAKTATNTVNGLNVAVELAVSGALKNIGLQVTGGQTLVGTLTPEYSMDGGTTYQPASFYIPTAGLSSSLALTNPNTAKYLTLVLPTNGVTKVRVRVSAFSSGNNTLTLNAQVGEASQVKLAAITDGFNTGVLTLGASVSDVGLVVKTSQLAANLGVTGGALVQGNVQDAITGTFALEGSGHCEDGAFDILPLSDGDDGVLRLTPWHGLHVHLRTQNGQEFGTAADPIVIQGAAGGVTVHVDSGSGATLALEATQTNRNAKAQITDGTRDGTVKAASTAAVATDTAIVVAISPNNTVPANIAQVGGAALTEGQKAMAASVPVVVASDQSELTVAFASAPAVTVAPTDATLSLDTRRLQDLTVELLRTRYAELDFLAAASGGFVPSVEGLPFLSQ